MDKRELWEKIKKLSFISPSYEVVFEVLESHLDRITFVKDHIGLRDFFFLAEAGTEGHYPPVFSSINVKAERNKSTLENEEAIHEVLIADPHAALATLIDHLENTDRPLFVGIGFKESIPSKEDILEIQRLASIGKINEHNIHQEIAKRRCFPEWYEKNAIYPHEAEFLTIKEELREIEQLKKSKRDEIMKKIDQLLDHGGEDSKTKDLFKQLSAEVGS